MKTAITAFALLPLLALAACDGGLINKATPGNATAADPAANAAGPASGAATDGAKPEGAPPANPTPDGDKPAGGEAAGDTIEAPGEADKPE